MSDRCSPARAALSVVAALALAVLPAGAAWAADPPLGPFIPAPSMRQPSYLEPVRDPAFGTPIVRITEPGRSMAGGRCELKYCTHRYSSAQAWNADQSLLVIRNGCGGGCFLDGRSYKPLFRRAMPNECEWHPVDPAVMICVANQAVYVWAPQTNRVETIIPLDAFHHAEFGPYKGNPSVSGDRIVVRARNAANRLVAFAVDIPSGRLHPPISLDTLPGTNNACTISASGLYIVCGQDLPKEIETAHVFTVDGELVQHWDEHHRPGHGDLAMDEDGMDVYVGISKSEPDLFHVIKRRLKDGVVTDLLPYGQISHASVRNTQRPGWVFLTFTGTPEDVAGTPENGKASFYQEIVALRIDGSGEVRRLVQTRNAPADYWSETHASPSPDGSRVIWSSNWGVAGGPVSDFVAVVGWPGSRTSEVATSAEDRSAAPRDQNSARDDGHVEPRR